MNESPMAVHAPGRLLVSVVDDDDSVREALPHLVTAFGFAARAFASAEEFLASDAIEISDCLILDVSMPGMSGPDLQRELARRARRIPIVFITANRDESARRQLLDDGAVDCLFKPFSEAALLQAIKRATSPEAPLPFVFVVDDDISVRESLELLIRCEGWIPACFESAADFLAHPRPAVPSCLLLDVSLPDLNGLDLQRRLATDRADMPIIFITGYGDTPFMAEAMKAGAVEFLTKPFKEDVLLGAIRRAIERSREGIV